MPSPHSWDLLLRSGLLLPELRNSPDEYDRRISLGIEEARGFLRGAMDSPKPADPHLLKQVHEKIFGDAHVDAGELRGRFNRCGNLPWHTAHPPLLEKALDHLGAEVEGLLHGADTEQLKAHAVAYQTAQAWRLQPFNDGNTRTVSLYGEVMAEKLLSKAERVEIPWRDYKQALVQSAAEDGPERLGDLGPLCKALTGVEIPSEMGLLPNKENYAHEVEFKLPSGESAICMAYGMESDLRVESLSAEGAFGPRLMQEAGKHPFALPATIVGENRGLLQRWLPSQAMLELDEHKFEQSRDLTVVHVLNGQEVRFVCPDSSTADLVRRARPSDDLSRLARHQELDLAESVRLSQDTLGNPVLDVPSPPMPDPGGMGR